MPETTPQLFIIIMRDQGYLLVGPFATNDERVAWGRRHAFGPGDDPRWQTIDLADPTAAPLVFAPEMAENRALAVLLAGL